MRHGRPTRTRSQATGEEERLARARLQRKIGFNWVGQGQFDRAVQAFDLAEVSPGPGTIPAYCQLVARMGGRTGSSVARLLLYGPLARDGPSVGRSCGRPWNNMEQSGFVASIFGNRVDHGHEAGSLVISDETLADARAGWRQHWSWGSILDRVVPLPVGLAPRAAWRI